MNLRRLATAFGVAAALGGFAVGIDPSLVSVFAANRSWVVFLALVAIVQGIAYAHVRRGTAIDQADTGLPETDQELAVPGDGFDETVAGISAFSTVERQEQVRQRLEVAAVGAIVRAEGCSEETARETLAAGTWTDDDAAASLFADGVEEPRSTFATFRHRLRGDRPFQHRARRAATEIGRLSAAADAFDREGGA